MHFYLKRKCCTFICYSQLWRLGLISSRFSLIKLPFVKLASSEDYLFFIRDNPPEPDATKNLFSELFCLVFLIYSIGPLVHGLPDQSSGQQSWTVDHRIGPDVFSGLGIHLGQLVLFWFYGVIIFQCRLSFNSSNLNIDKLSYFFILYNFRNKQIYIKQGGQSIFISDNLTFTFDDLRSFKE